MSLIGFHGAMMTLSAGEDPFYSNVSLLIHCDGANGGTSFPDNSPSPKTPTVFGSAVTSTAQKKFGSASLLQTTTSDRLSYAANSAFGFGTGDWTIEGWVRLTDTSSRVNNVFDTRSPSHTGVACWVGGGMFGIPSNCVGFSSNTAALAWGGSVPTDGSWTHVAWSRESSVVRGFVNGVLAFSLTDSRTYDSSAPLTVGADAFGTASQVSLGNMDEMRVTKAVSRYTSNFTPPIAPFPNS